MKALHAMGNTMPSFFWIKSVVLDFKPKIISDVWSAEGHILQRNSTKLLLRMS